VFVCVGLPFFQRVEVRQTGKDKGGQRPRPRPQRARVGVRLPATASALQSDAKGIQSGPKMSM